MDILERTYYTTSLYIYLHRKLASGLS